ncbi:extracellular solute-binding protein [Prosthecomicrobium pneumaticum]|uniref:ABC-type glycerol-3-phosphate transport system substrate-binding protein n=1 Tax=Prosthecomicrobium pneumaticum TaxID=81895 RepID=A0A7W9FL53_9HYPH|nr:extracellular solute-binding protein [Prosthecomicrobium pneumaticum]MBB5752204.1 ABC-type glycerol-3-phosphate transport system substrate-binding protein [Prosthecomicrobium pneumaticum]
MATSEATGRTGASRGPSRRRFLSGAAALGASAALAPLAAGRVRAQERKTLKLMSWEQFQPGEKDGWNAVLDKFNQSQSQYKVEWTGWPASQYASNVVIQAQAGGIDADILMAMPDLAAQTIRKFKFAEPLDPIVADLGITPSGGHAFLKQDGKLYGLSAIDVNFALVYNKALFEKAGVKPATSADEWVETTAKLTDRPNQFGIALTNTIADGGEWWFQLQNFCLPYDGKWAEGKTPLANSEATVKGLELWKRLYEAGVPQGTAQGAIMKLAADGRVAQAFGVNPTVVVLRATNPDIYPNLLSAAPPWASRRSLDRIHPLMALNTSKNVEGAMDFIKFAMQPDIMAELMETNLYVIPPYDLAAKSEKFKAFLADKPWVSGFNEAKQVSPIDVMGDFAYVDDQFGRIIMQNFQRALQPGGSVKAAMDAAQRQLEGLAARI